MKNFALLAFTLFALQLNAETVSVRGDVWCPFNCKPGDAKEGYMTEMAKEIFTKAGHTVDYKELNWSRTLVDVREGKLLGAVGASKDDAQGMILTPETMGKSQSCFYAKESETWTYSGAKSLESKSLGIVKDYAYSDEVDGYIKENANNPKRIDAMAGDDALARNVKKVLGGRIDLLLEDKNVVGHYLAKSGEKLKQVGCLNKVVDIYIAISEKHPKGKEIADVLNKGIIELRKSGKLKEILAKYGVADWK